MIPNLDDLDEEATHAEWVAQREEDERAVWADQVESFYRATPLILDDDFSDAPLT